jgi:catechol 2,3-dioxygenase-like lactoylglutathione lyase family enzyme
MSETPSGLPAISAARFGHVNVIARDWRSLADFYTRVFGCRFVPPERDYAGPDLEAGTGVPGAALRGAHLRLPGVGEDGPTLEIYQYASMPDGLPPAANRPGFQHIAFAVPSVEAARSAVLAAGGAAIGSVVTLQTADGRFVTWAYVTDPEGNIVELQSWSDSRP